MVYDPVRDCDVPSPAISRRPSLWETPPPISGPVHGHQHGGPPPPPQFQSERSPLPSPSIRPPSSAGLRSLLNDVEPEYFHSRRGSDHTVSSMTDDEAPHPSSRPHLAKLLNEPAPPLRPTSSHSATSESPRLSSPSVSLHPSSGARTQGTGAGASLRSPLISPNTIHAHLASSPASTTFAYPPYDLQVPAGPSSRRSSIDTQSMPPPAEPHIIHRHDSAAAVQASRLRSPAAAVSPSAQNMSLPGPGPVPAPRRGSLSRPTSARSGSGSFAAPLPPAASSSPEPSDRRLSDEASAASTGTNGRHMRSKYDPGQPSSYRSIGPEELARLRDRAYSNNPLRRKPRRAAPSWSAPSPRLDGDDGPRSSGPSRRGSTASVAERPSAALRDSDPEPSHAGLKRVSSEVLDGDRGAARRRTENYSGNAATVASHYNSRQEVGVDQREYSPIIGLKKFNNWVKSVLIGKFAARPPRRGNGWEGGRGGPPGAKVLDIGCGKGGDLNKWKQARISLYVGMDIAATSIDQARERYNMMRGNKFDAFFAAHDCYSCAISEVLPRDLQVQDLYDNVSMQFCMHYAFETPAKARMMMENVSRYLKSGGTFIGTIPNSALLL